MPEALEKRFLQEFVASWKGSACLFQGPEGSGGTEAAIAVAQTLLGPLGSHPDFIRLTPEKNAIKIEAIRDLLQRLSVRPLLGDRRVVLIEEAERMTEGAANALLKTLEEPPPGTLFILISAAPERLPATVRSRCQTVAFSVEEATVRERLGRLFSDWRVPLDPLLKGGASFTMASRLAEEIAQRPETLPELFELLEASWHDLVLFRETSDEGRLLVPQAIDWIRREASRRDRARLFEELDLILETERAIEGNVHKTLALERMFARLIQ